MTDSATPSVVVAEVRESKTHASPPPAAGLDDISSSQLRPAADQGDRGSAIVDSISASYSGPPGMGASQAMGQSRAPKKLGKDFMNQFDVPNSKAEAKKIGLAAALEGEPDEREELAELFQANKIVDKDDLYRSMSKMYLEFEKIRGSPKAASKEEEKENAKIIHDYGLLLKAIDTKQQAEAMFREAYERRKKIGADLEDEMDTDTLQSYMDLGIQLSRLGNITESSSILYDVIAIREKSLGSDHPDCLAAIVHVGNLEINVKKFPEARATLEKIITRAGETRDKKMEIIYLAAKHNIGMTYYHERNWTEAATLFEETYKARSEIVGPWHPDTGRSLYYLAHCKSFLEDFEGAEQAALESIRARKCSLGVGHVDVCNSYSMYAGIVRRGGKKEEAEFCYERAYEGLKESLGADAVETLEIQHQLGATCRNLKRYRKAQDLLTEVVKLREMVLGIYDLDAMRSLHLLGLVLKQRRLDEDAIEALEKCYTNRLKILGPNSKDTIDTKNLLAQLGVVKEEADNTKKKSTFCGCGAP